MEDEPLILRLNHVPLKEAMDKIADVFQADWVDHHDFIRLERSPERIKAIQTAVYLDRMSRFKTSIDELVNLRKQVQPLNDKTAADFVNLYAKSFGMSSPNEDRRLQFIMDSRLPTMRLAIQILERMDPEQLAQIPFNKRVVFSSSPNSMQLALPEIEPTFLQEYAASRAALAKAFQTLRQDQRQNLYELQSDAMASTGQPARIVVRTQPYSGPGSLTVQLVVIDDKGNEMGEDSEVLRQLVHGIDGS